MNSALDNLPKHASPLLSKSMYTFIEGFLYLGFHFLVPEMLITLDTLNTPYHIIRNRCFLFINAG